MPVEAWLFIFHFEVHYYENFKLRVGGLEVVLVCVCVFVCVVCV